MRHFRLSLSLSLSLCTHTQILFLKGGQLREKIAVSAQVEAALQALLAGQARLETQQAETLAKFQQDIRATLQAILAASQMTDSERAAAEENRGSSSDENDSLSDDE